MTLVDLVIVFLCGMQLVELYQHGSIFGPIRRWAAARRAAGGTWYQEKLTEFLLCPFCEAPWACAISACLWKWGGPAAGVVVFALAASRLANLVNDATHAWARSPADEEQLEEAVTED